MSKGIPSPHTFAAYCRNFSLDFSAGYAIMVSLKSFHIKIIGEAGSIPVICCQKPSIYAGSRPSLNLRESNKESE